MNEQKKVFVATPDKTLRDFLDLELHKRNRVVVHRTHIGHDIMTVLNLECPDLIIVDIQMPAMDGIEASLRIRQVSSLPILMLTAWGAGKNQVRGLNLASDSYLTAPFGSAELMQLVEAAFRRHECDSTRLVQQVKLKEYAS